MLGIEGIPFNFLVKLKMQIAEYSATLQRKPHDFSFSSFVTIA